MHSSQCLKMISLRFSSSVALGTAFGRPRSPSSSSSSSTTTTTTDMAPWSIASTCSSAMTHSFSESSNVLAQSTLTLTLTLTLTHTSTHIHSHTASLHEGAGEILTQLLLFLARLFN